MPDAVSDWSAVVGDLPEDTSQWAIIHSRWKDPIDTLEAVAPDEPFVQMMLAQRERIRRQYEEIKASVPEGLSLRERDEYVSARVMGAIASDVTAEAGGTP